MDGEFPWIYVAMIVIYFIAWVLGKIKDLFGGRGEEEQEAPPPRTMAEVEENRRRHQERQAEKKAKSEDATDVLRKLFETIAEEAEEAEESFLPDPEAKTETRPRPSEAPPLKKTQKSTRSPAVPPPLSPAKKDRKADVEAELTAEEKKALQRIKEKKKGPAVKRRKAPLHSLRSMTRGPGLRQAVVLKEILDLPRGLRPY